MKEQGSEKKIRQMLCKTDETLREIHNYRLGLVSVQESPGVLTVTIPLNIWYDPGSEDDKWTATVIYNASTGERISLTIA